MRTLQILLFFSLISSSWWSRAEEAVVDKRPLDKCFADLKRSSASGKIIDQAGRVVPGADVFLYYSHGLYGTRDRLAGQTKSKADGSFQFDKALVWEPVTELWIEEPPKCVILARHPSLGMNYKIILRNDPTEGIMIPLRPARSAAIQLRDPAGHPIEGAHVYLHMGWMGGQEAPGMDRIHSMFVLTKDIGFSMGQSDSDGRVLIPIHGAIPVMDFTAEKEGFTKTTIHLGDTNKVGVMFPSGKLEGTVTWPDGTPACDIAIHFRYVFFPLNSCQEGPVHSTLTDTAGHYVFQNTPANGYYFPNIPVPTGQTVTGKAQLSVEDLRPDSRCLPDWVEVSIDPGKTVVHDFRLLPACVIEGTVVDEVTSRTVPNINISCLGDRPSGQIVTDNLGRFRVRAAKGSGLGFRLDRSESGAYLVDWPPSQDRNQITHSLHVSQDISNLTIKTRLRPIAPLKGRVICPTLSKWAEVWVWVDNELPSAKADGQGNFSLKAVPADRDYDVLAIEPCQDGKMVGMTHVQKGTREITIQMEPLTSYTGVVLDQHGESVSGLCFYMHPCLNGYPLYSVSRDVITDARGQCVISGLCPRLPWLAQWNPCWSLVNHTQNQNVDAGESSVDLTRIQSNGMVHLQVRQYLGSLIGRIVGADGRPVIGAAIRCAQNSRPKSESLFHKTAESGEFKIDKMDRGIVELKVSAKGYREETVAVYTDKYAEIVLKKRLP